MIETVVKVDGMMCKHCEAKVTSAVTSVSGVEKVKVNLNKKTVEIKGHPDEAAVISAVEEAGYSAVRIDK